MNGESDAFSVIVTVCRGPCALSIYSESVYGESVVCSSLLYLSSGLTLFKVPAFQEIKSTLIG